MYDVLKITAGVTEHVNQFRSADDARECAVEYSTLEPVPFVVIRAGFSDPLFYAFRGMVGDAMDTLRRMSARPVEDFTPVVRFAEPSVAETLTPDEDETPPAPRRRRKGPAETKSRKPAGASEHKIVPAAVINVDEAQGVIEAIVNTYGIIDDGGDRVWYGSAAKTLAENFGRVRVLNSHNNRNVLDVVGKPLVIRELTRAELPPDLLMKWPDATGGLYTKTQYLLDTPEGLGVFKRIAAGAVDEYSIGFDALDTDMERYTDPQTGKSRTIRNIRTIRLWEYSPVVWGMNPGTTSVSVKAAPTDAKPYAVFAEDDQYCVYKVDEDGERMGDAMGCHATEDEANDQVAALYAAEADAKEMTPQGAVKRLGDCLLAELLGEGTGKLSHWLDEGVISVEEYNALLQPLTQHLTEFYNALPADLALRDLPDVWAMMYAGDDPGDVKAGRVLNERNYNAIKQAAELLNNVLSSAGLSDGADGDTPKARNGSNEHATDGPSASTDAPTSTEAGPQDGETPATKQQRLLDQLNQRLAEVEKMT